jgi:flagellar basal-body rod modification protein FlgD
MAETGAILSSSSDLQMQFMKLLITQLQNQNPLEPMDNSDMTAQLAQLASLQQMEQMNGRFGQVLAAAERQQATALIGKDVSFLDPGTGQPLSGPVSGVVMDADGVQVLVGQYAVSLTDLTGIGESALAESTYAQRLAAAEVLGKTVAYRATPQSGWVSGQVTAVTQRGGEAYVTFGDHTVPLRDVAVVDHDVGTYTPEDLRRAASLCGRQVLFTPPGQDTPESGTVEGVRLESDGIYVVVGGRMVPLSEVVAG